MLTLWKGAIPGVWGQRFELFERVHKADTDDQRVQHGLKDKSGRSRAYQRISFHFSRLWPLAILPQEQDCLTELSLLMSRILCIDSSIS